MKQLLVLLGVAGTSLSAVLVRWSTAPSLVLVFYRVAMASVLLAPIVFWKHRRELCELTGKERLLCLISGTFLGLHFGAYFESLRQTSIASSVVLVDTEVLFVALATVLIFRRRLSRKAWTAVLLAFGGSVVVAMADPGTAVNPLLGNCLALAGALCMAIYTMIGTVCRRNISTTAYTFLVYCSAAITVLVLSLVSGQSLTGHAPVNLLTALGMAVFCTLLGHSVFSWGLKYLPPAFISTVKLMEPVIASIWGVFLFGETPGLPVILGGAVIICGIALYSRVTET